jgi:hypothetical protein
MANCDKQPKCPICGTVSVRDYGSTVSQCRPEQASDAMGIHPMQIPEAVARFPHHRYDRDGRMLFKNNAEMQRCLKDLGYVDKNRH